MREDVELRELRVFLVLSEELHFGRTAERLGIAQSRVSSRLRQLESRLGVELVSRTSRRVDLTDEGRTLLEGLGPVLADLDRVLAATHERNRGISGMLRLGVVSPPSAGPHLLAILQAFGSRHPACQVVVHDVPVSQGLRPLRAGAVDLLAIRLPLDQPDLTVGPVLTVEPRVLIVARSHPLASRPVVSVEDLAGETVPQLTGLPPETEAGILPERTPAGAAIRRHPRVPATINELVLMVAQGECLHLSSASLTRYVAHPDVVQVPVTGLPDSRAALVWVTGTSCQWPVAGPRWCPWKVPTPRLIV